MRGMLTIGVHHEHAIGVWVVLCDVCESRGDGHAFPQRPQPDPQRLHASWPRPSLLGQPVLDHQYPTERTDERGEQMWRRRLGVTGNDGPDTLGEQAAGGVQVRTSSGSARRTSKTIMTPIAAPNAAPTVTSKVKWTPR